ncbi:MAG TPA: hypothetical protein VEX35_08640 [Allosphingosinicella sp.]|nr:hypothetical protein [Allosphingosinicella sp.]
MSTVRVGGEKSMSKDELERWIWATENNTGPLKEIACAQGGTVGTFDEDAPTPPRAAVVNQDNENTGSCPPGKTPVCSGRAYISGVCVPVVVCR